MILLAVPSPVPTDGAPPAGSPIASIAAAPPVLAPTPAASGIPPAPVSLAVSGPAAPLPSEFWGSTVPVDAGIVANESDFIRATPAHLLVWPGGGFGDRYDPIAGILHGGSRPAGPAASNESSFVALCRAVGCHAIFQVPGEINSSVLAAQIVTYTEQTLGFHPDYWEIGNEPALWRHFDIPWASWNRTQATAPTPQAYAAEVLRYGNAMRAADPSIRILGLPGVGEGGKVETSWVAAVAGLDGAWISGLAIHAYPAGKGPAGATLAGFLGGLTSANSLPSRIPLDRATLNASCGRCGSLPLFVTELGSAVLSGSYDPYVEGFPDAVFLGAEAVQAVELNLTNIDTFGVRFGNPGSWENTSSGVRPSYTLFSELLSHLGGDVQPLQVSGGVGGVYALETTRPGRPQMTDLFVVNANTSTPIQLAAASIPGLSGGSTESWSWDSATSEPVLSYSPTGAPPSWSVPPVGLLLVESVPSGAVPLTVTETGLYSGARWYVSVGNRTETSGSSQLTYFLPPGTYPVSGSSALWLPNGGRRVEFTPGAVVVGTSPVGITVAYGVQYFLKVVVTPSGSGTTTPESGWYNSSTPLALRAVPRPGFAFVSWSAIGPGGVAGAVPNASLSLAGQTVEVANFTAAAGPSPGPPPALPPVTLSNATLSPAVAIPVATLLVGAAVVLNFRVRRERGSVSPASPPEGVRAVSGSPSRRADAPRAGEGAPERASASIEAGRSAVLDRMHRLTVRAARLAPGDADRDMLVDGLRRALVSVRASRFGEADRILTETERRLDPAPRELSHRPDDGRSSRSGP